MDATTPPLLGPADPEPFGIENGDGPSPILFVSDHAGRSVPQRLGTLGLPEDELGRHIGYDIGIYGVTSPLARMLGATYVFQPYSRLVIDCNRRPGHPQSIAAVSDGTVVPGNEGLSAAAVEAREAAILRPYHRTIARILDERRAAGRPTVLFAMHSCTPALRTNPAPRPWPIMVMADRDWRVGEALIDVLRTETDLLVGVNEPYTVSEESDYTVPVHGEAAGIPYVEIELRQDLIATTEGQRDWAHLLARLFPLAVARSGVLAQ